MLKGGLDEEPPCVLVIPVLHLGQASSTLEPGGYLGGGSSLCLGDLGRMRYGRLQQTTDDNLSIYHIESHACHVTHIHINGCLSFAVVVEHLLPVAKQDAHLEREEREREGLS